MGLLDRWFKKKARTQLQSQAAPASGKKEQAPRQAAPAPSAPALPPAEHQAAAAPRAVSRRTTEVIVRPLVTEKSARGESRGQYTFLVSRSATKSEITRAVEELYGVRPRAVRVMHQLGKAVRFGRMAGTRRDTKKAIVILPSGVTLALHEGV
ncbi:MAG: 50S ribosomal protein L23 [Candidatus Magasanikbacteria bacterium]|nr:50S ribosomal protein L23 [Candidatus Magasanikbacteria bacterium]